MEKEIGHVKFIETDDGFNIEVKGKSLKEAISCCGIPMFGIGKMAKTECCPPESGGNSDCCPPGEKKT